MNNINVTGGFVLRKNGNRSLYYLDGYRDYKSDETVMNQIIDNVNKIEELLDMYETGNY